MRRHKIVFRPEWVTPNNDNEEINNGKKWKFNKNVSEAEKKKYRTKTHKENVELIVTCAELG